MRGNSSVLDITSRFHLGVFKTKLASWAANNVWREVAAWGHRRPSLPARAVFQYNELLLSRLLSGGIRPRSDISSQKKKVGPSHFGAVCRTEFFRLEGGSSHGTSQGGEGLAVPGPYWCLEGWTSSCRCLQVYTPGWALLQTNLHLPLLRTAQRPTKVTFFA